MLKYLALALRESERDGVAPEIAKKRRERFTVCMKRERKGPYRVFLCACFISVRHILCLSRFV